MNKSHAALFQNIITLFKLESLSAEEQEKAIEKIGDIVFQRVILKITELLTPEQLERLNEALQKEEQEPGSILQCLQSNVPNLSQVVNNEIIEFKSEYKSLIQTIDNQLQQS